ncbi:hypothetical protein P2318_10445 [Myxococcaceae bacterium GXIMD 01537]
MIRARQLLALLLVPLTLLLERLTYYGWRSVLIPFLTLPEGLGMDTSAAMELHAHLTLALSLTPVLGGVVGLAVGPRVALPVGMALNVLGFGLLAFARPGPGLYLALGVLVVGQALFRPNLFAVLGTELPDPGGNLRTAGMMLACGAINAGAMLAPMVFGVLADRAGFGISFGVITCVAAFTLLLAGGVSFLGHRAPPAPATSVSVLGIFSVMALFTLPYLTLMLGSEMVHSIQTLSVGGEAAGVVMLNLNSWTVIASSGLLFGVLSVLHFARKTVPAMWILGGGAVVAALSAAPLLLAGTGPGEPSVIVAILIGGVAEVLVSTSALSRTSAGPSPRVAALLLGVFFSWMGLMNHAVSALSRSPVSAVFLALFALGALGVGGVLLFLGRRMEQRLFAPPTTPMTPAPAALHRAPTGV